MTELVRKRFDEPDETRPYTDKGRVEIVRLGDATVGRATSEPGWVWTEHVRPLVGTESCEITHLGYVVSGRQKVVMDDGREIEVVAGDVFSIPAGHRAHVVGDEPCVFIDFAGMDNYVKPS